MTREVRVGRWQASRIAGGYARWIVRLRWFVVAGWVAAIGAAMLFLPAIGHRGTDLNALLSSDNPLAYLRRVPPAREDQPQPRLEGTGSSS